MISAHQALLKEIFGIASELRDDILVLAIVRRVYTEPDPAEVEFADEAFANLEGIRIAYERRAFDRPDPMSDGCCERVPT